MKHLSSFLRYSSISWEREGHFERTRIKDAKPNIKEPCSHLYPKDSIVCSTFKLCTCIWDGGIYLLQFDSTLSNGGISHMGCQIYN